MLKLTPEEREAFKAKFDNDYVVTVDVIQEINEF